MCGLFLKSIQDYRSWRSSPPPRSPEEVYATGIAEVGRIVAEMQQIIDHITFSGDVAAFLDDLRGNGRFRAKTYEEFPSGGQSVLM